MNATDEPKRKGTTDDLLEAILVELKTLVSEVKQLGDMVTRIANRD